MRKIVFCLVAYMMALMPMNLRAANTCFRGGPYLQELQPNGVTVVFENTQPTFAWVEVRQKGQTSYTQYYQSIKGQYQAYDYIQAPSTALPVQNFVVRVNNLTPNTAYEYRVVSQKIDLMKPYSMTFSTKYESDWYEFSTPDDAATAHRLLVLSDLHNRPETLEKFLTALECETADHVIYAGDMMDNIQVTKSNFATLKEEEPYTSFVNVSAQLFATKKDFCMLRGDHETKGDAADYFENYFPHQSGKLYNAYRWGDLEIVLLDGGEALPDDDPTGRTTILAAYNPYRQQEARWLEELIKTEEYQTAKYRIVVSHLPIPNTTEDETQAGAKFFADLMTPILNQANVDLLICGHLHPETYIFTERTENITFPTLVQGYNSALRMEIREGKITLKVINEDGNILLEKTL